MYAQAPIACDLSIHVIVQVRQDQHTPDRATGVEATESSIGITDRNRPHSQGSPPARFRPEAALVHWNQSGSDKEEP